MLTTANNPEIDIISFNQVSIAIKIKETPKIIITFGNQVSSIILNKKISVGECRKQYFEKEIGSKTYKVFPVYYPVGNGTFNIDKAREDLKYIIENYVKDTIKTK
mgnify:CR=1 FL=1